MDRCNLTILLELGYGSHAQFLAEHEVEIVPSTPCYSPDDVNAPRRDGVFSSHGSSLAKT